MERKAGAGRTGVRRRISVLLAAAVSLLMCMTVPAATKLDTTEEAYWDSSQTGVAHWKKVKNAKEYEVRLYESGDRFVKVLVTGGTRADFREYIRDGVSYSFRVRAVPKSNQKTYISGDWKESEDILEVAGMGETDGRWRTYSQGKKYQRDDKSYITDQWELIQGSWYYFGQDGFVRTGWQQIGSDWYYLGEEGIMQTGWLQQNGAWYYLNTDGTRATGWKEAKPGQWYYMDENGIMMADTTVDGYRLDSSGMWIP